ncbi:hypothetical protein GGI04_004944 [Coemansia thaxteri]|nr:hypothetical protein GGI04_004944 [Coemansia thaxteri]KAJ2472547.1 hypothetical protein GGI02_001510 [Coemansia sp. RSA 2322]
MALVRDERRGEVEQTQAHVGDIVALGAPGSHSNAKPKPEERALSGVVALVAESRVVVAVGGGLDGGGGIPDD